jgi:hypothetical protein
MPVLAVLLVATGHASLLWLPLLGLVIDTAILWSGKAWPFKTDH